MCESTKGKYSAKFPTRLLRIGGQVPGCRQFTRVARQPRNLIEFDAGVGLARERGGHHGAPGRVVRAHRGESISNYTSKGRTISIRDVFCYQIPTPLGAGGKGAGGPNQNTSRIQHKEV